MTPDALLERLLALTPPPPMTGDADQLLAAASAMLEARRALLASIAPSPLAGATSGRLAEELAAREAAWRATIAAARQAVGEQRVATSKLRRYR